MTVNCEFCNKTYCNKYSLKKHQTTAKSCLLLQNEDVEQIFSCKNCPKKFFRNNCLQKHIVNCVSTIKKKLKEQEEKFTVTLKEQEEKYKKKLKEQEEKFTETLKEQEEKFANEKEIMKKDYSSQIKDLQNSLGDLAKVAIKKPTTTTNNVYNLSPFDMEDNSIKDKIEELYNLDYLRKGHRGVAEFTKDNLLLDKKGNLKYICCDPSRLIFKYKDENGETRKDVKANRLSNKITPNIMNKAHSIVTDEVKKLESTDNTDKLANLEFYDMYFSLKELENKPEKLGTELSKIISK